MKSHTHTKKKRKRKQILVVVPLELKIRGEEGTLSSFYTNTPPATHGERTPQGHRKVPTRTFILVHSTSVHAYSELLNSLA